MMGEAAGRLSDVVVLTSDNPRSEDPRLIINDALVGLQRTSAKVLIEPDRERAIELALDQARPGDIVLLAGKGHETTQVFKDRSITFDDREVARRLLATAVLVLSEASTARVIRSRLPAGDIWPAVIRRSRT